MTKRTLTYTESIGEALRQEMEFDERVFLIGEGVDGVTGIYGTTLPAFQGFGEKRVIDTPLSENGLAGIAIGAAMDGMRPVLFFQRNDFMLLAMDQLVNHAAKICFMSDGKHHVPLTVVSFVARKPGEGAQHLQSLQAVFAHFPGVMVVMPTNPADAKGLLIGAIEDENPVIVLYHRSLFEEKAEVSPERYRLPLGKGRKVREGEDITIVSVSASLKDVLEAVQESARRKFIPIDAEVIDLCSVRPIDRDLICDSVKKTGRLLVVDTGWSMFGVSSEIIAMVCENVALITKPKRITLPETPAPASPFLLKHYYPDAGKIAETMAQMVS